MGTFVYTQLSTEQALGKCMKKGCMLGPEGLVESPKDRTPPSIPSFPPFARHTVGDQDMFTKSNWSPGEHLPRPASWGLGWLHASLCFPALLPGLHMHSPASRFPFR